MRYFFEISYNGTAFHGWQIQQNAVSVQQIVQEKLSMLINKKIDIVGSGRTDTGVHATSQVFHADLPEIANLTDFRYHLNSMLPTNLYIINIREVQEKSHARFDATSRKYKYVILPHKDPFLPDMAFVYHRHVDIDLLNNAAKYLIGRQDFQAFSKVKTQVNNFICELTEATWQQEGDKIVFYITANRFLRGMVRAIVGTFLLINEKKLMPQDLPAIIQKKNRKLAGRSVSACGLYLIEVNYSQSTYLKK